MHRQILVSAAVLGLFVASASAAPANNSDGGWSCNASGNSRESDGTCISGRPTEMAIICSGGMSSEHGGGEACSPAPAAAQLKLKHQLAKPGLRRRR
jgi:hypothetical protein